MARSASGSLRDRRTGRWPLSRLAGTRAKTLGALAYAAAESSPPARAPSLATCSLMTNVEAEINPSNPTGRPQDAGSAGQRLTSALQVQVDRTFGLAPRGLT